MKDCVAVRIIHPVHNFANTYECDRTDIEKCTSCNRCVPCCARAGWCNHKWSGKEW